MVADRDRFGLQFAAARNRHDQLPEVILAVATGAAIAEQRMRLRTFRFAAEGILITLPGSCFEDQMLDDVGAQTLATFLDADFLTVVLDLSVLGAEAPGAVLALPDQRFAAASQTAAVIASGGLAILADFHAFGSR